MTGHETGRDWVRLIEQGKGYSNISSPAFKKCLEKTERSYVYFKVLQRHVQAHHRVLEAGCGWAYSSFALAGSGIHVTALDISEKLIQDLQDIQAALGGNYSSKLRLVVGDIFKLEELGQKFDVIFNDGTYEHFLDRDDRLEILNNISGCLNLGGKYIVAVPNLENPLFKFAVDPKMPSMRQFRPSDLKGELESAGFEVIEEGFQFANPGFEQWLKAKWLRIPVWWIYGFYPNFPIFLKKLFSIHIYCVARKR